MNFEILDKHKFQFIKLVSCVCNVRVEISRLNFNDHSNLIHIVKGTGKVFFSDGSYPLAKGTVIALPAFVECHFEYHAGLEMLNVHYNLWDRDGELVDDTKRLPLLFRPDYFDYCEGVLLEMKRMKFRSPDEDLKTASMAHELVIRHYSSNPLTPSSALAKDERISKIYKLLKDPGFVRYDAARMAKECYLSVSQMNRKFKHYFSESPRKYWEKNRFNNVCHALAETDKPLAEIANSFDFSYQSHFSKWFKKIAHLTPADYRAKYSGETNLRP